MKVFLLGNNTELLDQFKGNDNPHWRLVSCFEPKLVRYIFYVKWYKPWTWFVGYDKFKRKLYNYAKIMMHGSNYGLDKCRITKILGE